MRDVHSSHLFFPLQLHIHTHKFLPRRPAAATAAIKQLMLLLTKILHTHMMYQEVFFLYFQFSVWKRILEKKLRRKLFKHTHMYMYRCCFSSIYMYKTHTTTEENVKFLQNIFPNENSAKICSSETKLREKKEIIYCRTYISCLCTECACWT